MGRAMLGKSLVQFSVDGRGCVPSLLFDLGPNYGGGNENNGGLLQKVHAHTLCPQPCNRARPTHTPAETPGHSQAGLGQPLVASLLLSSVSWCTQSFVCALQESVSSVLYKFWWLYGGEWQPPLRGLMPHQVCYTQSPCPCGRPLLTRTSAGDAQNTQRQVWLSLCGVSWGSQGFVCSSFSKGEARIGA